MNYYNYINIFDKSKTNILFSHRFYNHKLKFAENVNKNALFKNRISIYYQITNSNKSRNI